MQRFIRYSGPAILVLLIVGLTSCLSAPAEAPSSSAGQSSANSPSSVGTIVDLMAQTVPSGGSPTFLGVAQRRRDRAEEEMAALEHVGDQVARYLQISAHYRIDFDSSGRSTFVKENILTDWRPEEGHALIEGFEVLDTFQDNDNTYVLASVPGLPAPAGVSEVAAGYAGSGSDKPAWVNNPPAIPGYYVSVGITQRRRIAKDSIDFADEDALKGIIMTVLAEVDAGFWSRSVERQGETTGTSSSSVTGTGLLNGFYIVSRWISPDGQYYYSLAIAPVKQ